MAELLNLVGVVLATVATINYGKLLSDWLQRFVTWSPDIVASVCFWLLFVALLCLVHALIRRLVQLLKWELYHWFIQGIGLLMGGLRGLWWAGFILVALTASELTFFKESIEERSVLGPRLVEIARHSIRFVSNQFPGAAHRFETLVPPVYSGSKPRSS